VPRPQTPKPNTSAPYPQGWEPFLTAINAHLDDDTPRLVFADWLQENSDEARAEFIRLQCAAARGGAGTEAADALLAEHRTRWLLGLPEWCAASSVFRRGFVAAMTVLGRHWLGSVFATPRDAGGQAIRRLTALEELRIEQVWNDVVESPALTGLRGLVLPSAGSALIASLAKSPILPSLTDLTIVAKSSDGLSQRSFRDLFASPQLTRLRHLRVESMRFGNVVAAGLADPRFAGLEELRLLHVSLDATGAEFVARSAAAASLRVLDLLNNPIGDAGLRNLLASPGLRNVEELGLSGCNLTPASARALADWEGLRIVRRLNLWDNWLWSTEARVIRDSPYAVALTDLGLRS
jgi:uncharacterized protein (TIGR02996 family)